MFSFCWSAFLGIFEKIRPTMGIDVGAMLATRFLSNASCPPQNHQFAPEKSMVGRWDVLLGWPIFRGYVSSGRVIDAFVLFFGFGWSLKLGCDWGLWEGWIENIETTPCIPTWSALDSNSHLLGWGWITEDYSGNMKMTYVYRDFCWGLW